MNNKADDSLKINSLNTLSRSLILLAGEHSDELSLVHDILSFWGLKSSRVFNPYHIISDNIDILLDPTLHLVITDFSPGSVELIHHVRSIRQDNIFILALIDYNKSAESPIVNILNSGVDDLLYMPIRTNQLYMKLDLIDKLFSLKNEHKEQIYNLLEVAASMLGSRDQYTLEHSKRVASIAVKAAHILGFNNNDIEILKIGCLLHDIGKIAIPDDVLLKPGNFNTMDRRLMKLHPVIGAKFIENRFSDQRINEIILKHHERLDGTGYPYGLTSDDIGPLTRLVSVADIMEALIAKRPYKPPLSIKHACVILEANCESNKLDPKMVDAVIRVVETWDPRSLHIKPVAQDIEEVEEFRKICYFREPLANFFNYRFLLTIHLSESIKRQIQQYHLILIDFKDLREFNQRWGYLRADQCLDELGEAILQIVEAFSPSLNEECKAVPSLFRKGADYLLLLFHREEVFKKICKKLKSVLSIFLEQWGLQSRMLIRDYDPSCSMERALDHILGTEQTEGKVINVTDKLNV